MDVLALAFLGYETQQLSTIAGGAAGLVSAVFVVAVLGFTLAPLWSERWAEQFGVADPTPGPDPVDVVPGAGSGPVDASTGDVDGGQVDPGAEAQEAAANESDAPAVAADAAE